MTSARAVSDSESDLGDLSLLPPPLPHRYDAVDSARNELRRKGGSERPAKVAA